MLLIVEYGIRVGIFHAIYQFVKTNTKYMKKYDKSKISSYLKYWDINILWMGNVTKVTCN